MSHGLCEIITDNTLMGNDKLICYYYLGVTVVKWDSQKLYA